MSESVTKAESPLHWRLAAVAASGLVAGLLMLAVGWVFDLVEAAWPPIQAEYANKTIFRDWPGWSQSYMLAHPLWYGFLFALGYALLGRAPGGWRAGAARGAAFGALVFLVGSAPIFALMYASLRLSPELLLVSWAARNCMQYVVAGCAVGSIQHLAR